MGIPDRAGDRPGDAPSSTPDGPNAFVRAARRAGSAVVAGWMTVVRAFSWLVARVVAVVLFVVAFVPYAVVMRLVGFDPLNRDIDPDAGSFWTAPEASNEDVEDFRKLY
jgi:hypothetical protein